MVAGSDTRGAMSLSFRRLATAFLFLAILATACSSSDGGDAVDSTSAGDTEPVATSEPVAADDTPADPVPTSIPVPEDDRAADAAIAGLDSGTTEAVLDPPTTATEFVRNRFNIDPDPAAVACIVEQSGTDEILDQALQSSAVAAGDIDDSQLRSLTYALNGCVDSLSLGDWATQAVGPQGEVAQTAPPCFADRFDDPSRGDATFATFVSLTYQFRIDQDAIPDLVDALTTCAPISSLSEFFATQAEQSSGFETLIDRDCLVESISDRAVSDEFWTAFVEGGVPPVSVMQPYLDGCLVEDASSDLAATIPADFTPWSGTGALAVVNPAARANVYSAAPPMTIDPSVNYEAVFVTGGGEVRIQLFTDTAPVTVNNFVNLARDGYYDGTVFHRVLDQFMAQGGDPTGTGTGGPGYTFADEVDNDRVFDRPGLLAMANSGPATNGSQFFITTIPTDWLNGNHTIFGEVTEGYDLVAAIELRDPAAPRGRGQVVESVTIIES